MRSSYVEVLLFPWNLLNYVSAATMEIVLFDRLLSEKNFELLFCYP